MPFKDRHKQRNWTRQRRELGLCVQCVNPVTDSHLRCADCLAQRKKHRKDRSAYAASIGNCTDCFTRQALPHHALCTVCYLRQTSRNHFGTGAFWQHLQEMFVSQNATCALTGFPLTLGLNAEVDHIQPLNKGGERDISNTQWVLGVVNRMKEDMDEKEFFALVQTLYLHMSPTKDIERTWDQPVFRV